MGISALIVDDEQPARDELAFLLKGFADIEVVGQGKNGPEAVNLIRDLAPQLVFLDVQMPGLDGFGVIKKLLERKIRLPLFVFATAYDHYAVQAFDVNAIDYLLKPVAKARLEKTVGRVKRMIEAGEPMQQKLDKLVQMITERPVALKTKLTVKSASRLFLVDTDDIIFAAIQDDVIRIVARSVEGQSNFRKFEDLEAALDPQTFWRPHRFYLVNVNHVKEVVPWFKGSFQIKMDDRKQTTISVSRQQTTRLKELFKLESKR